MALGNTLEQTGSSVTSLSVDWSSRLKFFSVILWMIASFQWHDKRWSINITFIALNNTWKYSSLESFKSSYETPSIPPLLPFGDILIKFSILTYLNKDSCATTIFSCQKYCSLFVLINKSLVMSRLFLSFNRDEELLKVW